MALQHVSNNSVPHYTAVSTDVVDNKIAGAGLVGKIIFLTDTNEWKIITADLTLADYIFP